MDIVLHSGMHKTGTTSFQSWLRERTTALAAERIRVLTVPPQVNARDPDSFDPEWIRSILTRFEKAGAARTVISHEDISTLDVEALKRLRAALGERPVRHVTTFRHWLGFLPSRWMQNCRRRDSQSFPAFLERLNRDAGMHVDARFDLVLKTALEAGFEDRIAISWDNAMATGGILAPLCDACGIPSGLVPQPGQQAVRANTGDPPETSEMLRLFNGVRARAEDRAPDAMFDAKLTGDRVDVFFDQRRRVERIRQTDPTLIHEVETFLAGRRENVRLAAPDFADHAEALAAAAAPFLHNPLNGHLFPDPPPRVLAVSTVEVTDLADPLRARMLRRLRQAARADGFLRRAAGRVRKYLGPGRI